MTRADIIAFLAFQAEREVWLPEETAALREAVRLLEADGNDVPELLDFGAKE